MQEETKKRKVICIILSVLIIIAIVAVTINNINKTKNTQKVDYPVSTVSEIEIASDYTKNKKINSDYIGILKFQSGIVEEAVVQGEDNDEYLRTNWRTGEYDEEGTVFMDSENKLTDQNITLYGHYVYEEYDSSKTHKFTPLELLLNKENYKDNNIVSLCLDGETRQYQIVAVYICNLTDELVTPSNLKYFTTNWTVANFEEYKTAIKEIQLYDTGVDYNFNDKFLTLQTCIENKPYQREIVLCKEIKRS